MLAIQAEITVIDFEGTGALEGYPDEPWQVGMARLRGGRVVEGDYFESLLRVGRRPFNPYAPGLHRRCRAELETAPPLRALWPHLRPWLSNKPLAAHNAGTERKYLQQAAPLHRFGPWIDTLKLARFVAPRQAVHTLEDCVKKLGLRDRLASLCPGREAHDALYDALACGVLLEHYLATPGWEGVTVAGLARTRPLPFHRSRAGKGSARAP